MGEGVVVAKAVGEGEGVEVGACVSVGMGAAEGVIILAMGELIGVTTPAPSPGERKRRQPRPGTSPGRTQSASYWTYTYYR